MRDWRSDAECLVAKGHDPETWYPTGKPGHEAYDAQVVAAKEVCRRCPVLATCLADALDRGEDHGVFGGMDEYERRALKRRNDRRRPAPVTPIRPAAVGDTEPLEVAS